MSKPVSLIVILVVGVVLLVANKASVWKYARQDATVAENVASSTENIETDASTRVKKIEILDKATIIYTDSGFSPAVVTINVGGTVTFVNKSKEKNFSVQGLQNQVKTHIYSFKDAGEFAYSSVTHPERIGVVVVK